MFGGRRARIGAVVVAGIAAVAVSIVTEGAPAGAVPSESLSGYATSAEVPVTGVSTVEIRFDPYVNGPAVVSIGLSGGLVVASPSDARFSGTEDPGFARCTGTITAPPGSEGVSGTADAEQSVVAEGLTDCDFSFDVTSYSPGMGVVSATSSLGSYGFTPLDIAVSGPPVVSVTPSEGPGGGGTRVTVAGSGFTRGSTVDFGATPATGVKVARGGTSLTCVLPPGTGTGDVTVTTPGDGSGIPQPTDRFTYLGPTISLVHPSSARTKGGEKVVITGADLQGATVTIGGRPAPGVRVDEWGTSLRAVVPAGTVGPATVVITTPAGSASSTYASTS